MINSRGTDGPKTTNLHDATFAVVDVETTGMNPTVDRVVEVACVVIRCGNIVETFDSFVNPGREIPATASAIHHITNRDVKDAPPLEEIQPRLTAICRDAVVVAHNATFDLAFLPFLAERPVLCSMRFAMRVLPEAPNYKNQVLRYHLGVDDALGAQTLAHRALGDAQVTARILAVCIDRHLARGGSDDVLGLLSDVSVPRLLTSLTFGRYRGVDITNVPADYLRWIRHECRDASIDAHHTADFELRRRGAI